MAGRSEAFGAGAGESKATPTRNLDGSKAYVDSSGIILPKAEEPGAHAVAGPSQGGSPVTTRIIDPEAGIRELSKEEVLARNAAAMEKAGRKAAPSAGTFSQSTADEHVRSLGREVIPNNKLISAANEHGKILHAKITELEATHGDHPVVGPIVAQAKRSLIAGSEALRNARPLTQGRDATRETQDQARPMIREGLAHLLEAHDHLTHPVMSSNGVSAPAISRTDLETNHGYASAQERLVGFRARGKAPKQIQIGQGETGARLDMTTEEGQGAIKKIRTAVREKTPGVDVNVGRAVTNTRGTTRVRKAERDAREAEGMTRGVDTDRKRGTSTSQSNVNVPKANISTTTGQAPAERVFVPGQEGPGTQQAPATPIGPKTAKEAKMEKSRALRSERVKAGLEKQSGARWYEPAPKVATPSSITDALGKINKKSRGK